MAFVFGAAQAGDISARIAAGNNAAAASPEGQRYESLLGPALQAAMSPCVPAGSTATGNLGKFTLVGDVAKSGAISSVEVEPSTAVSRCFAANFRKQQLPKPPKPPSARKRFPLTLVVSVVP